MALQYASAIAPQSVLAAHDFVFVSDQQGPNDEPGQKDLTAQASDQDDSTFYTAWKWDDTSWPGSNTGDACSLFDTDIPPNGNVDYAVCVTVATSSAVETSTRVYSCGDAKPDRCTNPELLSTTLNTICTVDSAPGQFGGTDTQATCNITLIGISSLSFGTLLNTCSYPSQEPNSDPSDCVLTPTTVVTTLATQVRDSSDSDIDDEDHVSIGTVAYDTADLSGNTRTAGGTVTYYVEKGDASCTIDGATPTLGTKTVTSGNVPDSDNYTFASAGTYEFWAVYSGASNNGPSTSPCETETVIVDKASPTISTTASATVSLGNAISDTATLAGLVNPSGTRSITFNLYAPGDTTCTGTVIYTNTVAVLSNGDYGSGSFTPTGMGTYRWIASYSGDDNNNTVTGACNDANESVIVTRAVPTVTTQASATVVVGNAISDSATLTGLVNPSGTRSITFNLYGPDDATCTGAVIFTSTVAVTSNGSYSSGSFTPSAAGTYRWIANYSGDDNNAATANGCNAANESVTVTTPDLNTVKLVKTNNGAFGPNSNAVPGDTLTFQITVSNTGDAVATNVPVSDNINALLARGDYNNDCSNSCGFAGGILTWTIPTIAANGGSVVLTFSVDLDEAFPEGTTTLPNVVVVTGPGSNCPAASTNPDCDTTTSVSEWQLEIAKTNNAPLEELVLPDDSVALLPTADEGETVTYTLSYTVGQLDVTGATIVDVLPAGLQYVNGSATGNTEFTFTGYDALARTLSWTAATITQNGSVTYRALVLEGASELSQPLSNLATIDSAQTNPDESSSDVFVPVIPLAETNVPTPPQTDVLIESNGSSAPGSSLMLLLAVLGLLVLGVGFVTPVPAAVRRRNQR